MSVLPQDTFLGKLEIVEVYEYYDKPVLFACRNAAQTLYLVVLVDGSEHSDTWLYAAVSQERFQQIRTGTIDLFTAFKSAEDEMVYEVTIFTSAYPSQLRLLPVTVLSDDVLPVQGEKLSSTPVDDSRSATG